MLSHFGAICTCVNDDSAIGWDEAVETFVDIVYLLHVSAVFTAASTISKYG